MPLVAIPESIESLNRSEKSVMKSLKWIYLSEKGISYLYLEPKLQKVTPDFILIDPDRGVVIIEVKAWRLSSIKSINN
ncbi:MAG: hypothetical protein GXO06_05900, partial [Epsilonproteobacteria bacterium]|nr:hypothetical protein [Campylobacterota bacterium]